MPDPDQPALFEVAGRPVKRVRRSCDLTIKALRDSGRLEACDALLVALLRTTSDRCDELRGADGKEFHEAQALRLTGELEARLRSLGGPQTDAFDQLLAAATGPAPPGHPA
ncbi:MAG TPA: hypothetical protein VGH66_15155 [Acidimicrobiales bacterium]|jgi:hypothetical protein